MSNVVMVGNDMKYLTFAARIGSKAPLAYTLVVIEVVVYELV